MAERARRLAIGLALAMAGCARYAGRLQVTVESDPSHLCFYVVPLVEWQRHGEAEMLHDRALARYQRCATPKRIDARDYTYVLVVDCPDGPRWDEIQPRMGADNRFLEQCR